MVNKAFLDRGEVVGPLESLEIVAGLVPWELRASLEILARRETQATQDHPAIKASEESPSINAA